MVKKALSSRVIDEQTPENIFNLGERLALLRYEDTEYKRGLQFNGPSDGSIALSRELELMASASSSATLQESIDENRIRQNSVEKFSNEVKHILNAFPQDNILKGLISDEKLGGNILLEIQDESILLADVEEEVSSYYILVFVLF